MLSTIQYVSVMHFVACVHAFRIVEPLAVILRKYRIKYIYSKITIYY